MLRRYKSVRALITIGTPAALAASRAAAMRRAASAMARIGAAPRGVPSSRLTPTAPAWTISATDRPTACGVSPNPASISAVSGAVDTRAMRAVAATISGQGAASPSA